eukprot:scaffold42592_cov72-Phaeocystis_antarctica.AAC.1
MRACVRARAVGLWRPLASTTRWLISVYDITVRNRGGLRKTTPASSKVSMSIGLAVTAEISPHQTCVEGSSNGPSKRLIYL